MNTVLYKLVNKKVVPVKDPVEWAMWMMDADNRVKYSTSKNGLIVSTVFLGVDAGIPDGKKRPPLTFETIVFKNSDLETDVINPLETVRTSSWERACEVHLDIIRKWSQMESIE